MANNAFILLVLVVVVVVTFVVWQRRARSTGPELGLAWLPRELRGAKLVYAEQTFCAEGDITIIAKLDRGYRNPSGVIILVELKTRSANRPYFSDVIELSAQRLAVHAQTGERVAAFGYVLVQRPGRLFKSAHRVDLMSAEDVGALARRREYILNGHLVPRYTCSKGLCGGCAFMQECEFSTWSGPA